MTSHPQPRRPRTVSQLLLGALIGLAVGTLIGTAGRAAGISFWGEEDKTPTPAVQQPAQQERAQVSSRFAAALPNFADLAATVTPEVVNISTTSEGETGMQRPGGRHPSGPGDPFGEFWGPFAPFLGPMPRRHFRQRSLGSGFIIGSDGLILTNNHVIENADKIIVTLKNEKEYEATIVGRDPKTDIAVIKIKADDPLTVVNLGDSDKLRVGDWVLAIGNSFGLSHTVTAGIVSAKGRFIGQGNYDDFIQTDAAINPGNSGGPLLNLEGQVVGINSAIYSRSGGNIGIGFAIPINLARELLPELREKGHVTRGWLGVYIQKITPAIAESLGIKDAHGALVADVMEGTPAAEAGIEVGDVIVQFDGRPVKESNDLPQIVARATVGKTVDAKVIRHGETRTITVKVGKMKDEEVAAGGAGGDLGLAVQTLTPAIAENIGIDPKTKGVVVVGVASGSVAEESSLRRGDVILEVNRQAVENAAAYRREVKKAGKKKSILFLVRRGDNTLFLALKPPSK